MPNLESSQKESLNVALQRFDRSSVLREAIRRTGFASFDDCALDAREELQEIYSRFIDDSKMDFANVTQAIERLNSSNTPTYDEVSDVVSAFRECLNGE